MKITKKHLIQIISHVIIFLSGVIIGLSLGSFGYLNNDKSCFFKQPLRTHHFSFCAWQENEDEEVQTIMKYGCPQPNYFRIREGYILSYDARAKNPYWVYEYITPENLSGTARRSFFKNDPTIILKHRANLSDYSKSGYDKGHLAAAGNHKKSQVEMDETFYITNMSPQVGIGFNRGYWRNIEEKIREIARNSIGVHVITGPLYLPKNKDQIVQYPVIGQSLVAVPTHFFKIGLVERDENSFDSFALLVPNEQIDESIPFSSFATTIDKIERASGLIFFDKLYEKEGFHLDKSAVTGFEK